MNIARQTKRNIGNGRKRLLKESKQSDVKSNEREENENRHQRSNSPNSSSFLLDFELFARSSFEFDHATTICLCNYSHHDP
mmetsp:Transcript_4447/g.7717  ORF Transcript_4447/g.7717 Transcript_4447/m.7717 type:complete len:81 (-) Transcript_4447:103-345(-)